MIGIKICGKKLLVLFTICLQLTAVAGVVAQNKLAVEKQFRERKNVMGRLVGKTVKLAGDQVADVQEWTADTVNAAFESLTVDKPVFESAGFKLSEIEIEIGLSLKLLPFSSRWQKYPKKTRSAYWPLLKRRKY